MSSKTKTVYLCSECGDSQPRWAGQCGSCNEWNTLSEYTPPAESNSVKAKVRAATSGGYAGVSGHSKNIDDIDAQAIDKIMTGIGEFDRVMGEGVAVCSVNLLSGDPGAGKTTLLTKIAAVLSEKMVVQYCSAEENEGQFSTRLKKRFKYPYNNENFKFHSEDDVEAIIQEAIRIKAKFLIVDSIQAMQTSSINGAPGSISQVRGCAQLLNQFAKQNNVTTFIVGHVTKSSDFAGPAILRHIVDGSFHIEVNDSGVRTIRASKNRFGDAEAVGIFKMAEQGMVSVDNPSKLFLSSLDEKTPGTAISCIRDGNRNMLLEVQALASTTEGEHPQRICIGLNMNRLKMILAIIRKHGKIAINHDVYINLVGGLKLPETDTSADVAMAMSIVSSLLDKPLPKEMCSMGELSLNGEVRPIVAGVPRVKEAIKHGFTEIIVPYSNYHKSMEQDGVKIYKAKTIHDVLGCIH